MSVLIPEGRVAVKEALPALGALCFFIFAWGLMHGLDRFCRALFGTVEGAVGWIPFGGKLVKHSLHKIEQKLSHLIGGAERGIDAHIATSWHKLSRVAAQLVQSLFAVAVTLAALGLYVVGLPAWREVRHLIHAVTRPLRAGLHAVESLAHDVWQAEKALKHWVDHQLWSLLRVLEAAIAHAGQAVIDIPRWGIKPLERALADLRRWLRHRKLILTTGAFLGAFAWALTRYGIGYVRCSNVKKVGRAICRMPASRLEALLGLLAAVFVVADIRTLAHFAEAVEKDAARGVADLVGVATRESGQFTIE